MSVQKSQQSTHVQKVYNSATGIKPSNEDLGREHLLAVKNPDHTAVCKVCRYWITIGPDGTEYGHARGYQFQRDSQTDCPHRPSNVDPTSWKDSLEADRQ